MLLAKYFTYIHPDIISACTLVKGLCISDSEAILLSDININHSDQNYKFIAGKDYIALIEEILDFYVFLKVCSRKLQCKQMFGNIDIFGFIRFHTSQSMLVVPYVVINETKFVPIIFFKNISKKQKNIKNAIIKLKNLNLAYLKFCCKVQGIIKNVYDQESCLAIDFNVIKIHVPIGTYFEYNYWPININNQLESFNQSSHVPNMWIKVSSIESRSHNMILRNHTNLKRKSEEQMVHIKIYLIYC